jgi:ADP-dependent NAD(P)H-hydrate dehydratase / NAD(P)H-hydrate epimerase
VIELLTSTEMADLDRETIEQVGIPGMVLMENAADGCARAIVERWSEQVGRGVVIVAGPGNNGGDGHVIARKLANRGIATQVLLLADPSSVRGDARTNLDLLPAFGVQVFPLLDEASVRAASTHLVHAGVVVDALFGTGLERPMGGRFAAMVEVIHGAGRPVMAVDIPSGVNASTGEVLGCAVRADLSVTFCRPKRGHFLHPGAAACGEVEVVDIGVPEARVEAAAVATELLGPDALARLCEARPKRSHKGTYGHLLILAGSETMPGAAVLAANAALVGGVGLVTLAVPQSARPLLRGLVPEVIVATLPSEGGSFAAEAADHLAPLLHGKTAVAIGPGVGRGPGTTAFVRRAADEIDLPVVVDADGLRALERRPSATEAPRVLTPHPGEMAAMLGLTHAEVEGDRSGAAVAAAKNHGAVVVLKGAASLVASPEGTLLVNPTGNPGMASAGTGDVLTGLLGSLLAQPRQLAGDSLGAAAAAVYLHGLAGDLAADEVGEASLMASDITEAIPAALAAAADGELEEAFRWR